MNQMSSKKATRSNLRTAKGKFEKTETCCACNKPAGVHPDAHPMTDQNEWSDQGIVLCPSCYKATREMTKLSDFLAFRTKKLSA